MRAAGVRGPLIYCSDYHCSHWIAISGDQWPDDVRLSDLEPRFTCQACGRRGARSGSPNSRELYAGLEYPSQGSAGTTWHSSIAITMDIYSHLMPNMQGEAAAVVDGALHAAINKRADDIG
jgi:hypothetical protein